MATIPKPRTTTPGRFFFTADSDSRTILAEGWLVTTPAPRSRSAQAATTAGNQGYHAGHLIPACFGGPGDQRNLVPMPARVNTSYVKSIENEIGRCLVTGPVYLRVTVDYGGAGPVPASVIHEFFHGTPGGLRQYPNGLIITTVDAAPSVPMGGVTDPHTGKKIAPKDWLDPSSRTGQGPSGPN